MPKRLPSGRWTIAHRINVPRPIEDEDDDENDFVELRHRSVAPSARFLRAVSHLTDTTDD